MFLVGFMILCSFRLVLRTFPLLVSALGLDVSAISVALSLVFVLFDVVCSVCVISYEIVLFAIGELLDIGVAINFWIFFTFFQFLELI